MIIDPRLRFSTIDHWIVNTPVGETGWTSVVNATGTNTVANPTAANPGLFNQTVAAVADTAIIRKSAAMILVGGGVWRFDILLNMQTLSNATDEYIAFAGFFDNTGADAVDGIYFEYDRATTTTDVFRVVTASNSTRTKTTTATTIVAGTFYHLAAVINAGATSVEFFIDGVSQATITTNIPSGAGRFTSPSIGSRKTVGSASVIAIQLDLAIYEFIPTVPFFV